MRCRYITHSRNLKLKLYNDMLEFYVIFLDSYRDLFIVKFTNIIIIDHCNSDLIFFILY